MVAGDAVIDTARVSPSSVRPVPGVIEGTSRWLAEADPQEVLRARQTSCADAIPASKSIMTANLDEFGFILGLSDEPRGRL
jgi:hypothetical protein